MLAHLAKMTVVELIDIEGNDFSGFCPVRPFRLHLSWHQPVTFFYGKTAGVVAFTFDISGIVQELLIISPKLCSNATILLR